MAAARERAAHPGPNRRDPHRRRAPLAARFPCHVTLKVQRGIPSLRSLAFVRELERSLRAACERGCFRVAHYSIQADYLHLIVEAASAFDLRNEEPPAASAPAVSRPRTWLLCVGWRGQGLLDPAEVPGRGT